MTDSCARMLGAFGSEELKARYLPRLTSTDPDALWQGTQWMTERTGGSDVGASTTVARRGEDGQRRVSGQNGFGPVATYPPWPGPLPAPSAHRRTPRAAPSVIVNGAALLDRRDAGAADARALARVWTPLAKYWITLRARDVTAEAMNVRGGNGYVEEWVNPRLLRDAYLGAIWEGSANVVALDVQRAIAKDRGLEALAGFMAERLARVTEPAAKPWVDLVKGNLEAVTRQAAGWAAQSAAEREAGARPVAGTLLHQLPGSLLLAEGQLLREQGRGYRKLLAAGLYLKRWLEPRGPAIPPFGARQIEWLDPLAAWRPIDAAALADVD